ncbi:MAG: glycosyltransferase family 39 protein [Acutalibacteraceae bacterium]|nr:glycosyltransferase family 39 protein [Acutalibacteraceae bacterium]
MKKSTKKYSFILRAEFITLFLLVFSKIIYFFCLEIKCTADSYEYIARNGFDVFSGVIDRYRLPVYPVLIDLCTHLFEDNYLLALCYFQLVLSLVSIVLLYITMKNLTEHGFINLSVTTLYVLCNAVIGWDKTILTESLSLSLTVIIAWGVILYLKKNSKKAIIIAVVAATIGCFLRAVFAIYAGLILGFLILRLIFPGKNLEKSAIKTQRLSNLKCTAIAVVPVILLMLYAGGFYQQYGAFTLSDSGLGQQVTVVLATGYYLGSPDEEIKEVADVFLNSTSQETLSVEIEKSIDSIYKKCSLTEEEKETLEKMMFEYYNPDIILAEAYEKEMNTYFSKLYENDFTCDDAGSLYMARCYIMNNFSRERINTFVSKCKKDNIKSYVLDFYKNATEEFNSYKTPLTSTIASLLNDFFNSVVFFFRITLLHGIIIGFLELVIFVVVLVRKKFTDWLHLGLAGFILSTAVLSILGTNAEFARTSITMIPFMFISVGLWINLLYTKFICKNKD